MENIGIERWKSCVHLVRARVCPTQMQQAAKAGRLLPCPTPRANQKQESCRATHELLPTAAEPRFGLFLGLSFPSVEPLKRLVSLRAVLLSISFTPHELAVPKYSAHKPSQLQHELDYSPGKKTA